MKIKWARNSTHSKSWKPTLSIESQPDKIFAISGLDTLKKECHKILDKIAHFFASTDHLPLPAVNGVFRILLGPHASCPPRSGLSPPNRDLPTNQKAVSRSNDFSRPIRLQPRDAPRPGFLYTRFDRTSQWQCAVQGVVRWHWSRSSDALYILQISRIMLATQLFPALFLVYLRIKRNRNCSKYKQALHKIQFIS